MRGLLDIQWKLAMAVVGVSFVCLAVLNQFNRRIGDFRVGGDAAPPDGQLPPRIRAGRRERRRQYRQE